MTQREEVVQESYEVKWTTWEKLLMSWQSICSLFMLIATCVLIFKFSPPQGEVKKETPVDVAAPKQAESNPFITPADPIEDFKLLENEVPIDQIPVIKVEPKKDVEPEKVLEPPELGYLEKITQQNGLDPELIKQMIYVGSKGDPQALGTCGSRGLMQISLGTWSEVVHKMGKNWSFQQAYDPKKNLAVGCFYLSYLRDWASKRGSPEPMRTALVAYNGGMGNFVRGQSTHSSWRYAEEVLHKKQYQDIDWASLF